MADDGGAVDQAAGIAAVAVAARAVPLDEPVDEQIVAGAVQRWLEEACPEAAAEIGTPKANAGIGRSGPE